MDTTGRRICWAVWESNPTPCIESYASLGS